MKHEVGHCKLSLSLVKQRMKDNYVHNWNGDISNTSRGILYNHTPCFQFQPYLDILTIDKSRICLTKIRVSSHRLTIETGRWENPMYTHWYYFDHNKHHFICSFLLVVFSLFLVRNMPYQYIYTYIYMLYLHLMYVT